MEPIFLKALNKLKELCLYFDDTLAQKCQKVYKALEEAKTYDECLNVYHYLQEFDPKCHIEIIENHRNEHVATVKMDLLNHMQRLCLGRIAKEDEC